MNRIIIFVLFLLCIFTFISHSVEPIKELKFEIASLYYLPNQSGLNVDNGGFAPITYSVHNNDPATYNAVSEPDPGRDLGSSWGGIAIEARFIQSYKFMFAESTNPLLKDRNFTLFLTGRLSPITMGGDVLCRLSPLSILNIDAGSSIGTGWNIGFNGMGRNLPGMENDKPQSESFQGAVYKLWSSITFQFDAGQVWQGKWNHVITSITPKLLYIGYTNADKDEAWQWENDNSDNFNGLKYLGSYFLGYKIPDSRIDTIGCLVTTEQYIDQIKNKSKMSDNGWGSDFVEIIISPLTKIKLSEKSNITVLLQIKKQQLYSSDTMGARYFEYRSYIGSYYCFYGIAFLYDYKF